MDRSSVEKLIDHQIYSYIHIVDCRSSEILYSAFPYLDDVPGDMFDQMKEVLDSRPDNELILAGTFEADEQIGPQSRCVRLNGGGYSLTRVNSSTVTARVEELR